MQHYWIPNFLKNSNNITILKHFQELNLWSSSKIVGWCGEGFIIFLDLHDNLLQGPFPTLSFLSLRYISVSNCKLTREIPSLIFNTSFLDVLDLSHNNLSGVVPECLVHSNVLSMLDLWINSLHGTISATFSKGNNFRNIKLNGAINWQGHCQNLWQIVGTWKF